MPTRLPHGAWVLVADGEKALFLVNQGDPKNPDLKVVSKEEQDNPPTRDQAANRRGRVQQSAGEGRSAYSDTDWHELAKERFASELADLLYRHAHKDDFKALVVCASRPVLSTLRNELHVSVNERIIAEIPKVLTGHPVDETQKLIMSSLAAA